MIVEVLYIDDCPGHAELRPLLRRLDIERMRERRIGTVDSAAAERFLGSPTVRVNGVDVEPGAQQRTDYGIKCRLYRTDHGLERVPAEAWLRAAIGFSAA